MTTDDTTAWRGRLFLAPGLVLYVGVGGAARQHVHHAVQFVWADQGGTFDLVVAGRRKKARVGATLIPARVEHEITATNGGGNVVLMLVDGHGARGTELDQQARSLIGKDLSEQLSDFQFPSVDVISANSAETWCHDVLAALGVETTDTHAPSRTTRRALLYIEQALDAGVPRLADAAAFASTSESRLSHRFTEEVGLPFRRFILWTRVKRAVEASRRGGDLTEAALAAGFSDAAHLSRTFRAMFGLSPSDVLPFLEIAGKPWAVGSPLST
jgi:AraC-like DNA-binding protein